LLTGAALADLPPTPAGSHQERIDELSHKHDGFYGALAPQFECAENDRNPVDANGNTGFKRE
jgi:hypothetical protein